MSKPLTLSVLDQSPVPTGSTPAQALKNSVSLAQYAESLGFRRFWMSEHHAMATLACSAPEIMLARIGAETSVIRLGSGGVMLTHYSAFKVAETFRTLHALYPNRIDLGIGRAPGGGPIESAALRRNRTAPQQDDFPDQLSELLAFLHNAFPANHPFSKLALSPEEPGAPDVWLLGSSMWSSDAAAQFGLPYAFAHFFSPDPTRQAIEHYRETFQPNLLARTTPQATAAVGVIVAETDQEAQRLLQSVRLLQLRIRQNDRRPVASPEEAAQELPRFGAPQPELSEFPRYVAGTPDQVHQALTQMATSLGLDELIVNTITHDHRARLRSYTLLAEVFALNAAPLALQASYRRLT